MQLSKTNEYKNKYQKEYRHRVGINKKYLSGSPFDVNKWMRTYFELNPWRKVYKNIITRCYFDKNSSYFNRGIKCYLTIDDIKFLWLRDCASNMLEPSIDRIDGEKDYYVSNCRFIELKQNKKQKRTKKVRVFNE